MAKRIEGPYDFSNYSFQTYADGATWELTKGEDFNITAKSLAAAARRWARDEGLNVEVKQIDSTPRTPEIVAVRFRRVSKLQPVQERTA
jgi:hypothetical protein